MVIVLACVPPPVLAAGSTPRAMKRQRPPVCPLTSRARPSAWAALPSEDDPVELPRKRAWEAARGGKAQARPFVRARLRAWPTRVAIDPATLPADDDAFLRRLAADTWHGISAFTDRENGLPVDHVRFPDGAVTTAEADVGDYTSISTVGLHLVAIVAARELRLIAEDDAVAAITRVLDTLDRLESYAGFLFNYYDTTSLERSSNLLSFIDTAWLAAGLIVARSAFPALTDRCSAFIARADFSQFYDPKHGYMSHGYSVHRHTRSRYDYGVLYTEARLGVLLASGKGDVPEDAWFRMVRTYPAECAGQNATPAGVRRQQVRGHEVVGGSYEWGGVRFVPSWGGSMFEALMPALVLDEQRHAPHSLGANDAAHATVQRRYATEELGYPLWGMSPCAAPGADGYREFGVPVLGMRGYGPGVVTPHAAALALLVTPEVAVGDLRGLAARAGLYGEYGLYDAIEPRSGAVAPTYLALDQSMLFIALANHLRPHCVQERFASDPIVQRALPVLADERFFD
jgi:hypothetical protein